MSLTTVTGSHESLEYHAVYYCAQVAQFSVKSEILQFLSGGAGSVMQSGQYVLFSIIGWDVEKSCASGLLNERKIKMLISE